jgi:hypothetical protein
MYRFQAKFIYMHIYGIDIYRSLYALSQPIAGEVHAFFITFHAPFLNHSCVLRVVLLPFHAPFSLCPLTPVQTLATQGSLSQFPNILVTDYLSSQISNHEMKVLFPVKGISGTRSLMLR